MKEVHEAAPAISGEALFQTASPALIAPEQRDPNNPATWGKIGRNETCPCGSGKKFKHCHGALV
jgi:preprotein translocase subunit SecA